MVQYKLANHRDDLIHRGTLKPKGAGQFRLFRDYCAPFQEGSMQALVLPFKKLMNLRRVFDLLVGLVFISFLKENFVEFVVWFRIRNSNIVLTAIQVHVPSYPHLSDNDVDDVIKRHCHLNVGKTEHGFVLQ